MRLPEEPLRRVARCPLVRGQLRSTLLSRRLEDQSLGAVPS